METKKNDSEKVDEYMSKFEHPLKDVLVELRQLIMSFDKSIGEEIKWNAPAFFYTGEMEPSDPKLYKRYIAVSNIHYKDHILLIIMHGADVDDESGFLEGDYKDGRRLVKFYGLDDLNDKKSKLEKILQSLLQTY